MPGVNHRSRGPRLLAVAKYGPILSRELRRLDWHYSNPEAEAAQGGRSVRPIAASSQAGVGCRPGLDRAWGILLLVQGLLPVATVYLVRSVVNNLVVAFRARGDFRTLRPALVSGGLIVVVLLLTELLKSISNWVRTASGRLPAVARTLVRRWRRTERRRMAAHRSGASLSAAGPYIDSRRTDQRHGSMGRSGLALSFPPPRGRAYRDHDYAPFHNRPLGGSDSCNVGRPHC